MNAESEEYLRQIETKVQERLKRIDAAAREFLAALETRYFTPADFPEAAAHRIDVSTANPVMQQALENYFGPNSTRLLTVGIQEAVAADEALKKAATN